MYINSKILIRQTYKQTKTNIRIRQKSKKYKYDSTIMHNKDETHMLFQNLFPTYMEKAMRFQKFFTKIRKTKLFSTMNKQCFFNKPCHEEPLIPVVSNPWPLGCQYIYKYIYIYIYVYRYINKYMYIYIYIRIYIYIYLFERERERDREREKER